jgi:hypothetical protein
MTHSEFRPYYNCPIRFRLKDGAIQNGLLFDQESNRDCNPTDTTYQFIKATNFQEFQTADTDGQQKLSEKIDIAEIVWAQRIIW